MIDMDRTNFLTAPNGVTWKARLSDDGTGLLLDVTAGTTFLELDDVVKIEDRSQDRGVLDVDGRLTCHCCGAWATGDHLEDPAHQSQLDQTGPISVPLSWGAEL